MEVGGRSMQKEQPCRHPTGGVSLMPPRNTESLVAGIGERRREREEMLPESRGADPIGDFRPV